MVRSRATRDRHRGLSPLRRNGSTEPDVSSVWDRRQGIGQRLRAVVELGGGDRATPCGAWVPSAASETPGCVWVGVGGWFGVLRWVGGWL